MFLLVLGFPIVSFYSKLSVDRISRVHLSTKSLLLRANLYTYNNFACSPITSLLGTHAQREFGAAVLRKVSAFLKNELVPRTNPNIHPTIDGPS